MPIAEWLLFHKVLQGEFYKIDNLKKKKKEIDHAEA